MANFFEWFNKAFESDGPIPTGKDVFGESQEETKAVAVAEVVKVIKPQPKLYTAEDVQRDLAAMVLLFMSDIQQEIERKDVPMAIQQDAALLSEFGFSNAKNTLIAKNIQKEVASHNKSYEEKKSALAFMEEVWKKFGKEAMVVRYDQFFEILEKYDMVCGSFDRYTGTIPKEALEVLTTLKGIWEKGGFSPDYGMAYGCAGRFDYTNKTSLSSLRKRMRMPFLVRDESVMAQLRKLTSMQDLQTYNAHLGTINDALFIAAPAADMKPLGIDVYFPIAQEAGEKALREAERKDQDLRDYPHTNAARRERIRNNAIRKEEEYLQMLMEDTGIGRYCKCRFIKTQPLPERKVLDPFICSLTHYGVLIHAKWGAEAEDATIKRYEQLRNAIIGKGGAV